MHAVDHCRIQRGHFFRMGIATGIQVPEVDHHANVIGADRLNDRQPLFQAVERRKCHHLNLKFDAIALANAGDLADILRQHLAALFSRKRVDFIQRHNLHHRTIELLSGMANLLRLRQQLLPGFGLMTTNAFQRIHAANLDLILAHQCFITFQRAAMLQISEQMLWQQLKGGKAGFMRNAQLGHRIAV